ncbi:hypothetical protein V1478_000931, partial [Vespula squamosa]
RLNWTTRSSNKKQRARTIEDYDEGISIITIGNVKHFPPGLHQQRNVLHHHLTAGYHGSHNFIQERDQGILFRRLLPSSKYVRGSNKIRKKKQKKKERKKEKKDQKEKQEIDRWMDRWMDGWMEKERERSPM